MQCKKDLVIRSVGFNWTKSRIEIDCLVDYVPSEVCENSGLKKNVWVFRSLICEIVIAIICIFMIIFVAELAMVSNCIPNTFF